MSERGTGEELVVDIRNVFRLAKAHGSEMFSITKYHEKNSINTFLDENVIEIANTSETGLNEAMLKSCKP